MKGIYDNLVTILQDQAVKKLEEPARPKRTNQVSQLESLKRQLAGLEGHRSLRARCPSLGRAKSTAVPFLYRDPHFAPHGTPTADTTSRRSTPVQRPRPGKKRQGIRRQLLPTGESLDTAKGEQRTRGNETAARHVHDSHLREPAPAECRRHDTTRRMMDTTATSRLISQTH